MLSAFRKTLLGPTYGSPLEKIQILPTRSTTDPQKCYLAYVTKDKVRSLLQGIFWSTAGLDMGVKGTFPHRARRSELQHSPSPHLLLSPDRLACRFCLWMATPTSPQLSFATQTASQTWPAPTTGATSLQRGGTTALF